jgi:hypothetical protein
MDIEHLCSPLRCRFIDLGKELRGEILEAFKISIY